ncbi:hypothetical protein MY494_02260 [Synechococcus sp. A10-1-5-1]|uniref:hypothetical protein n=1 Tax=Synechococcus sp. A10-1-5-1 TaxID=2936507 RepID=UPI002001CF57|nr:hypothetical protein [Synechococcus sp. A10-1-5-1]UPM50638.1 hypothetical protein MY494_02260 [Synechococcus sp. A10-1-5-1]
MNPAALTRHDQLEQEWQQRLLMQSSSNQAKKETDSTPPRLSPLPDPKAVK